MYIALEMHYPYLLDERISSGEQATRRAYWGEGGDQINQK